MDIIQIKDLEKSFKVLKRNSGLKGAFKDLFSRDYRYVKAVDKISMNVKAGEIVGYLGPNGAGKSTTIKMMSGILKPTSGDLVIDGRIPHKKRLHHAQNIGLVFGQRTQLWWNLPVIESFKIIKEMYQIDTTTYTSNLEFFDQLVGISSLYLKPVRQLSLGQRILCDILAAFLHDPRIIFLDEPTIGLDVSMKNKIRNLIKELNIQKNTTVILTTHDLVDVEALCQRVIIIDEGKIIFDDSIKKLRELFGTYRTLKVKIDLGGENIHKFFNEVKEKYGDEKSLKVSMSKEEWIDLLIDESQLSLTSILNYILNNYKILDVMIEEVQIDTVVRKIYEGK